MVNNFDSTFHISKNSKILLTQWVFENFIGNCLELEDPKVWHIEGCTIGKSTKSGLNIVLSDVQDHSSISRVISIKNCTFSNNNQSGLEIYSDDFVAQNLCINLDSIRSFKNGEVGIFLARVAISELKISQWKAINNKGKGWLLKLVHHYTNQNNFIITDSRFSDNKDAGLTLDDTGVWIYDIQWNGNGKNGISINGTFKPDTILPEIAEFLVLNPMTTTIKKFQAINNKSHGVSVKSYWKGDVLLDNGTILRNSEDGLLLYNQLPKVKKVEAK